MIGRRLAALLRATADRLDRSDPSSRARAAGHPCVVDEVRAPCLPPPTLGELLDDAAPVIPLDRRRPAFSYPPDEWRPRR